MERYIVMVNSEEQFSIWPVECEVPQGWTLAGKEGSREECLEFIKSVWRDWRWRMKLEDQES